MPVEIDPLSQLIGGLSAQVNAMGAQLIDLRSEIVLNRSSNQTRYEELVKQLDMVQAEYRNVKHMERNIEQDKISLGARLQRMDARLGEIERVILIWRVRVSMLLAGGVAIGSIIGFLIEASIGAAVAHIWR